MTKNRPGTGGLVYSTDAGRMCPICRRAVAQCACRKEPAPPPGDGTVRVLRETKGRNGKAVTVVRGVPLDKAGILELSQELKAACGSGGTVKDGGIEVQGDHVDKVMVLLRQRGWRVKQPSG